jgi:aminobenzoyl-glutamate utilization protein A
MSAVDAGVTSGLLGWIALRHDLQRRPEHGFIEYCTAARLAALGYDVRVGPQVMRADALIGRPDAETIEAARSRSAAAGDGPVVTMRFDMDALQLIEAADDGHGMVTRSSSRRWATRLAPSPVPSRSVAATTRPS